MGSRPAHLPQGRGMATLLLTGMIRLPAIAWQSLQSGGWSSKQCDEGLGVCWLTYLLCFYLLRQLPEDLLPALVPSQLGLVLSKLWRISMSSGRQLTPGFPCCSVPATLLVKPVPGDTACGLREGFGSSRRKGHLFCILIVSTTASYAVLAKSLWYLKPVPSQICSAIPSQGVFSSGWSMWVSEQSDSRCLCVCQSYLLTRCWKYGMGLECGTGQEFSLGRGRVISERSGENILA